MRTKIEECTDSPWAELPLHHPFAELASLGLVQDSLQLCVLGVITLQPGVVERDTAYGRGGVCNAVIKQGTHDIRYAFWRDQARALAAWPVGAEVALMQVTVRRKEDSSWELFASEATQVLPCPPSSPRSCTLPLILARTFSPRCP